MLVQFMMESTLGLHRDSVADDAMKKTLATKLSVYNLSLTDNHEVSDGRETYRKLSDGRETYRKLNSKGFFNFSIAKIESPLRPLKFKRSPAAPAYMIVTHTVNIVNFKLYGLLIVAYCNCSPPRMPYQIYLL